MATAKANVNTWLGQAHKYCKVYLIHGTPCPTTHHYPILIYRYQVQTWFSSALKWNSAFFILDFTVTIPFFIVYSILLIADFRFFVVLVKSGLQVENRNKQSIKNNSAQIHTKDCTLSQKLGKQTWTVQKQC